jgi:hypothetical protein
MKNDTNFPPYTGRNNTTDEPSVLQLGLTSTSFLYVKVQTTIANHQLSQLLAVILEP